MTGQVALYGGVTGVAATNVITIPGSSLLDGSGVTFTTLAGGAGLSVNTKYYLVNVSGTTAKLSTSQGGTAIDFTTDITSATILLQNDDLLVWSGDFRDVFSSNISVAGPTGNVGYTGPGTNTTLDTTSLSATVTTVDNSDEVAHEPLRQTQLARSYWKFTMSVGASPLYAEVLEGDIISDSPPNTP
jgi:hypothetical protein